MYEPSGNIKKLLSKDEKVKLKFTKMDRERVFQKIEESSGHIGRKLHPVKILIPVAAAIIIIGLLLPSSIPQQVLASIPFFNSFFAQYGDEGQKKAVETTEFQQINQTVEDNGVKVTFHEILYDGARISVSYTIEATSGMYKGKNLDFFAFVMKVDGQDLTSYGFSGGSNDKKIENQYLKVQNIDLNKSLPEKFTLSLSVYELLQVDDIAGKRIKGNWAFSFPVEKKGESIEFSPNVSKKTELGEIKVRNIVFAPSGTLVEIACKQTVNPDKKYSSISYDVLYSNNKELKILGGRNPCSPSSKPIRKLETKLVLAPLKEIPESITIQPYYDGMSEIKTNKISITEKLPFFLDQGANGGIVINKIEKKPGEVWVYLDVKGDFAEIRKRNINLMKGNEMLVINKVGDIDNPESKDQLIKFKTPYSDDLIFSSSTFFKQKNIEEWKLTIPINKEDLVKKGSN